MLDHVQTTRSRRRSLAPSCGMGPELTPEDVSRALQRGAARCALMQTIECVVRARVALWMRRLGAAQCARLGLEDSDLVQEILIAFYDGKGLLLRRWNPERGLSLRNWVGLVTRQLLSRQLAKARRSRCEASDPMWLDESSSNEPLLEDRDELVRVLRELEARLTPQAQTILVETCLGEDAAMTAHSVGISEQAVYAARYRFTRLARELRANMLSE